jgi:hypothetical protein
MVAMITRSPQSASGVTEDRNEQRDAECEPSVGSWRTKRCHGAEMAFRFFPEMKMARVIPTR